MFFIIDDRPLVTGAQIACFEREGVAAAAATVVEFLEWFDTAGDDDIASIEGFLLAAGANRKVVSVAIRARSRAPVIGVMDGRALTEVLELFAAGADDVVVKPCHVREILARISAIRRRQKDVEESIEICGIHVFFDGREPLVGGDVLSLPRRERRILEYLVASRNTRVSKTQIFNRVYGLFNEGIQECVVESHISRLRKRLRHRLGYDPIESQRYLGYRLADRRDQPYHGSPYEDAASPVQGLNGSLIHGVASSEGIGHGTIRSYDDERVWDGCAS